MHMLSTGFHHAKCPHLLRLANLPLFQGCFHARFRLLFYLPTSRRSP